MRGLLLLMLTALVAFGADDEWTKVRALKTGAELRVYKKGSTQPILAQMADLTDENLVVFVKRTQTAIPKDQIDRIDARPPSSGPTKETTTKQTTGADGKETTTTSTSYGFSGKPDFQIAYRRALGGPKK